MTETKVMTPRVWHNQFKKALVIENPHPNLDAYLEKMGIQAERHGDSSGVVKELQA